MFKWISGTTNASVVTLAPHNLTLNSVALTHFENSGWCCIGIDQDKYQVALRPISKKEVDLNLIPSHQLHKVSIGKGYARISNKNIATKIGELIKEEPNGQKFPAHFDEKEKMLIIDLKSQIRRG